MELKMQDELEMQLKKQKADGLDADGELEHSVRRKLLGTWRFSSFISYGTTEIPKRTSSSEV